jgi:2-polyprenyl-6-methoxyphenol hydroxylase-like FAD-dependent oxidoreductase
MKIRIVIAGGGYAGLFAAARLRKNSAMRVTLIDARRASLGSGSRGSGIARNGRPCFRTTWQLTSSA